MFEVRIKKNDNKKKQKKNNDTLDFYLRELKCQQNILPSF